MWRDLACYICISNTLAHPSVISGKSIFMPQNFGGGRKLWTGEEVAHMEMNAEAVLRLACRKEDKISCRLNSNLCTYFFVIGQFREGDEMKSTVFWQSSLSAQESRQ